MSFKNVYLKQLHFVEHLVGLRVSSDNDTGEKEVKTLYPAFLLIISGFYTFSLIYPCICMDATVECTITPMLCHKVVRGTFVASSILMGIYKVDKTPVSMKLEEIENYMTKAHFEIHKAHWEKVAAHFTLLVYLIHLAESASILTGIFLYNDKLSFFDTIINIYFDSVKCTLYFGCVLLLTRCLRIQLGIRNDLDKLRRVEERVPEVSVVQIFQAWVEDNDDSKTRINLIKQVQYAFTECEQELQCNYGLFVCWVSTVSAVCLPSVCITILRENMTLLWMNRVTLLSYIVLLMTIVIAQSRLQSLKQSNGERLGDLLKGNLHEDCCLSIRREILANFHRPKMWNCYFFDLDISLLFTILEMITMVCSAMFSEIKI